MSRRSRFFLFLSIVAIQLAYAGVYRIVPAVDARAYDRIAQNIVAHGLYAEGDTSSLDFSVADDLAISRVGPGYEYFLAGVYATFGRHVWLIWILQAFLYAGTVTIVGSLALKLMPEWATPSKKSSFVAVLMFSGFFIDAVQLNAMLMTESLALFLLALVGWFLYAHTFALERVTWKSGAALGALLGLAILTRTNYVALLVPLFVLFFYYRSHFRWGYIMAFFALCIAVQAPWIVRNYAVYDTFVFHTTAGGNNLFIGNYPPKHGVFETDFPQYQKLVEDYPNPVDLEQASKRAYSQFLSDHPGRAFTALIEKSFLFFSLTKTSGFWFHYFGRLDHWGTVLLSIAQNTVFLFSFFLFICMAILRSYREWRWLRWEMFLVVSSIFLVVPSIATIISNRYRLLLLVIYTPALLYAVQEWHAYSKKERIVLVALPAVLIIFSTLLDVVLQMEKVIGRVSGF
mgnify:CR=1 FL=1